MINDYSRIQRVHEAFPFGARARPPSGSGGSLRAPGSESGSLETSICPCPRPQERSIHRFPMETPTPQARGRAPDSGWEAPTEPQDSESSRGSPPGPGGEPAQVPQKAPPARLVWGRSGGPDGPPEGPGWSRLRPAPGRAPKVRCVGFFKGTLKVRPGRNRLAFQILRQMTH